MRELETATKENKRLRRENTELRQRVAAFESSRWWKVHPRLRLRDLTRRLAVRVPHTKPPEQAAGPPNRADSPGTTLAHRFREEVMTRGVFTEDWFTRNIPSWEPTLRRLDEHPSRILEIGSFEGLSACYLLWRLPQARLTCIDTFEGSDEHIAYGNLPPDLEERFCQNVALVDASRVRTVRGDSGRVLLRLIEAGELFDLVYVDGSHFALDVLVDAALSWQLLVSGGVLIFDDYRWDDLGDDPLRRPGPAIDAFLGLVADYSETFLRNEQAALRKLH